MFDKWRRLADENANVEALMPMEAQAFFVGAGRYALVLLTFAVIAAAGGLLPLAVGWLLGQRRLGVYGFLTTATALLMLGPLLGVAALLACTVVVAVVSVKRRRGHHGVSSSS